MFTIKVYDQGSMDYTAYSAEKYRREYVAASGLSDPAVQPAHERLVITLGEGKAEAVPVYGTAYVENMAGKTIERIGFGPRAS